MLKLGRVTKVKVFLLVLVHVFNIDLFEFAAAILEKGLLAEFLFIRETIISALKKNRSFSIIPQIFNFIPLISRAHYP